MSPPLSPTPSLSTSLASPPSSPSVSSIHSSISDLNIGLSLSSSNSSASRPSAPQAQISGLPPLPATQLSPHYVVSITDILASLARAYAHELPKSDVDTVRGHGAIGATLNMKGEGEERGWSLDPETMVRKRRDSMNATIVGTGTGPGKVGGLVGEQGEAGRGPLESWKWAIGEGQ